MQNEPVNPKWHAIGWVVLCALVASIGCQRRAYTDLYAESMAGEIRELEDRIYEYDAAYQGIEEELAVLQSENDRLHQSLAAMKEQSSKVPSNGRSLFKSSPGASKMPSSGESYNLRESYPTEPEASFQVIPSPDPVPSIVPAVPPNSSINSKVPSADKLPAPIENKSSKSPNASPKKELDDLVPPAYDLGKESKSSVLPPSSPPKPNASPSQTPSIDSLQTPPTNQFAPPPLNSPPTGIQSGPPTTSTQPRVRGDRSVQAASHLSSESKRDSTPDHSAAIQALPGKMDDDSIDEGKIELPSSIQPAAFQRPASQPASPATQDNKVIEIAFHPTMCRGQYLGSDDRNDGMYLVLQPRNAAGESIDVPASLTIVVLDPNRPESQSKLGRWTLTKDEVDAQLEPVGIGHGFHIPLKWQDAKPSGDAVHVHVRYEMEDGRRLVNDRRIQLHVQTIGGATWTPRVAK